MQRRAYRLVAAPAALAAAAVLAAGLTGCSGGSGGMGGDDDPKPGPGESAPPTAEPGKYHSLPEPCGYVSRETLRRMLPGGGEEGDQAAEELYRGQPTITYDADRRVGCRWNQETPDGTRRLSVDFERVVSYQAGVSDEERAQQLYNKLSDDAHIPASSSVTPSSPPSSLPAPPSGGKGGPKGPKDPKDPKGAKEKAKNEPRTTDASSRPATTATPPAQPPGGGPELGSRALDDVGDNAFVSDKLVSGGSGAHRDVTVVFRSANVLVTIVYHQQPTDRTSVPSSQDLQGKAHVLAREIEAGHFSN
ncbi:hypothetical protein [Streptomyces sp. I05A-00742]|uniref:hypothetical protein n=1 Tax=Streptomyces sp. I05A-00742 TaxID=2732853 RepID=UPI00148959DE|nr:hypothetical protein [Streptomyces sp. I05A-00742]